MFCASAPQSEATDSLIVTNYLLNLETLSRDRIWGDDRLCNEPVGGSSAGATT